MQKDGIKLFEGRMAEEDEKRLGWGKNLEEPYKLNTPVFT